jgi:hypothetical protein
VRLQADVLEDVVDLPERDALRVVDLASPSWRDFNVLSPENLGCPRACA